MATDEIREQNSGTQHEMKTALRKERWKGLVVNSIAEVIDSQFVMPLFGGFPFVWRALVLSSLTCSSFVGSGIVWPVVKTANIDVVGHWN